MTNKKRKNLKEALYKQYIFAYELHNIEPFFY